MSGTWRLSREHTQPRGAETERAAIVPGAAGQGPPPSCYPARVALESRPATPRRRTWMAVAMVSALLLVMTLAHLIWALATGTLGGAVMDVASLALWYWIGVGALKRA